MATCVVFRKPVALLPVALGAPEKQGAVATGRTSWEAESPPALFGSEAGHVAGLSDPFRGMKLGAVCSSK